MSLRIFSVIFIITGYVARVRKKVQARLGFFYFTLPVHLRYEMDRGWRDFGKKLQDCRQGSATVMNKNNGICRQTGLYREEKQW